MERNEVLKVKTCSRLYRGAKLEIAPGVVRRVVREDASISRDGHTVTVVEVELVLPCVGDWIISAEVV